MTRWPGDQVAHLSMWPPSVFCIWEREEDSRECETSSLRWCVASSSCRDPRGPRSTRDPWDTWGRGEGVGGGGGAVGWEEEEKQGGGSRRRSG